MLTVFCLSNVYIINHTGPWAGYELIIMFSIKELNTRSPGGARGEHGGPGVGQRKRPMSEVCSSHPGWPQTR